MRKQIEMEISLSSDESDEETLKLRQCPFCSTKDKLTSNLVNHIDYCKSLRIAGLIDIMKKEGYLTINEKKFKQFLVYSYNDNFDNSIKELIALVNDYQFFLIASFINENRNLFPKESSYLEHFDAVCKLFSQLHDEPSRFLAQKRKREYSFYEFNRKLNRIVNAEMIKRIELEKSKEKKKHSVIEEKLKMRMNELITEINNENAKGEKLQKQIDEITKISGKNTITFDNIIKGLLELKSVNYNNSTQQPPSIDNNGECEMVRHCGNK